jgi:hypothetical protein
MTYSLSQKTLAGPIKGLPIILGLYQIDSNFSTAILKAMNSLPKELLSTVFRHFEYQSIGALFR